MPRIICIDTPRLTPIQSAPLADLPNAHRAARMARGSRQNPQNRMAGARQETRNDGNYCQPYDCSTKGKHLSHLTQDIYCSGLINRGLPPNIPNICWVAVLAISMLAGCGGGGGGGGGTGNSVPLNQPLNPVVRVYSAQEVRLSWIDNSANEDGFIVEKSLDNITFTEVGRVGRDTVTFSDMTTANNQMLYYRVATYQGTNLSTSSDTVHAFHYFFDACVSSPVVQNTSSGKLYPLTISGLNYSSDYHSSVTDKNSSFGFDATANTRFSIGYIPISKISAKALTSTSDLVAGITLGTSSATNAEMNILRLLLALDGDSNSTNGIQLPCNLSTASGDIDFTLNETAFANQADVIRLLNGNVLPTQAQALTEFQNARNRYYSGNYAVYYSKLLSGMYSCGNRPYLFHYQCGWDRDGDRICGRQLQPPSDHGKLFTG